MLGSRKSAIHDEHIAVIVIVEGLQIVAAEYNSAVVFRVRGKSNILPVGTDTRAMAASRGGNTKQRCGGITEGVDTYTCGPSVPVGVERRLAVSLPVVNLNITGTIEQRSDQFSRPQKSAWRKEGTICRVWLVNIEVDGGGAESNKTSARINAGRTAAKRNAEGWNRRVVGFRSSPRHVSD